ncbi:hypothetical protein BJ741DRAFT_332119 [Chytriomyces cf. hyalinus JEL632]|nr:hypothetical protein BJ741DRAFT_332119 [Chytriomyces cf. hyalinus JEL632]
MDAYSDAFSDASSDAENIPVHYADTKPCSITDALHFLAANSDTVFKPKLNVDVLALICAFLPPAVCGFCQRIHKSEKFDCSRCHSEYVFCKDTPLLVADQISEANKCDLPSNSDGFKCMNGFGCQNACVGRICARCVQSRYNGPYQCCRCYHSFVYCCRWHNICDECYCMWDGLEDMPDYSRHGYEIEKRVAGGYSANSVRSQDEVKESMDVEDDG